MTINHRETVVNGITTSLYGQGADSETRRLAASIPRNAEVKRVTAGYSTGPAATVWLDSDAGGSRLKPPEGYRVHKVLHTRQGSVGISMTWEGSR